MTVKLVFLASLLFKTVKVRGGGGAYLLFWSRGGHLFGGGRLLEHGRLFEEIRYLDKRQPCSKVTGCSTVQFFEVICCGVFSVSIMYSCFPVVIQSFNFSVVNVPFFVYCFPASKPSCHCNSQHDRRLSGPHSLSP